jgi:hypothetical protein
MFVILEVFETESGIMVYPYTGIAEDLEENAETLKLFEQKKNAEDCVKNMGLCNAHIVKIRV